MNVTHSVDNNVFIKNGFEMCSLKCQKNLLAYVCFWMHFWLSIQHDLDFLCALVNPNEKKIKKNKT